MTPPPDRDTAAPAGLRAWFGATTLAAFLVAVVGFGLLTEQPTGRTEPGYACLDPVAGPSSSGC